MNEKIDEQYLHEAAVTIATRLNESPEFFKLSGKEKKFIAKTIATALIENSIMLKIRQPIVKLLTEYPGINDPEKFPIATLSGDLATGTYYLELSEKFLKIIIEELKKNTEESLAEAKLLILRTIAHESYHIREMARFPRRSDRSYDKLATIMHTDPDSYEANYMKSWEEMGAEIHTYEYLRKKSFNGAEIIVRNKITDGILERLNEIRRKTDKTLTEMRTPDNKTKKSGFFNILSVMTGFRKK